MFFIVNLAKKILHLPQHMVEHLALYIDSILTPCDWLSAPTESQRYCTVHCTGYMRTWPTRQLGTEGEGEGDKDCSYFSCLVAVGRVHPHTLPQANGEIKVKPTEFVTRYAMDGKFTFVDQRYVDSRFQQTAVSSFQTNYASYWETLLFCINSLACADQATFLHRFTKKSTIFF